MYVALVWGLVENNHLDVQIDIGKDSRPDWENIRMVPGSDPYCVKPRKSRTKVKPHRCEINSNSGRYIADGCDGAGAVQRQARHQAPSLSSHGPETSATGSLSSHWTHHCWRLHLQQQERCLGSEVGLSVWVPAVISNNYFQDVPPRSQAYC